MAESILFKGGLPYGPDVNTLKERFPVSKLTEGTLITHQELEETLGLERKAQRYRGVINSWISHQRDSNGIFLAWAPGQGVKVLDPAGLLEASESTTRRGIRQVGRGVKKFGWVDRTRLDGTGQKRYDHQARVLATLNAASIAAKKELAIDLAPIQSLPKRRIAGA